MINNDGKSPDTTEAMLYLGAFVLWIMLLTHIDKKWGADTHNDEA